jgi:hypothetical protein
MLQLLNKNVGQFDLIVSKGVNDIAEEHSESDNVKSTCKQYGLHLPNLVLDILFLGVASRCVRYQDFIMEASNLNKVFYLFSLFHSRHYMFWPVRAITSF